MNQCVRQASPWTGPRREGGNEAALCHSAHPKLTQCRFFGVWKEYFSQVRQANFPLRRLSVGCLLSRLTYTHIVVGIVWITENCRSKLKACRSCLCKIRARACINGKKFLNSILFRDSISPRWCKWSFHLQRNACSMEDASGIQNPICNIVLEMAMAVFSESPIIDVARLSGARADIPSGSSTHVAFPSLCLAKHRKVVRELRYEGLVKFTPFSRGNSLCCTILLLPFHCFDCATSCGEK